ncbi:MAG TPA: SDR family NAD(P)-dependent oxidoreductase [Mycobacterium sp.]|nr:SDR family NAD(P)-dependent oxidoreductase [Mycobacterium sp.]
MTTTPVALVTGATSGIGAATAYRLQSRGYLVFAAGRNPAALDTLRSRGLQARAVDVTEEAQVDQLVEEINTAYGGVDVLVNNAGFGLSSPLEQVALRDVRAIFETNVVATLHLCQAVLPSMRARRSGIIINVGSTAGRMTTPGAGAYHITKYGIEALSDALRAEVRPFGVRVVLIEPTGVRETGFIQARGTASPSGMDDDPYGEFKSRYSAVTDKLAESRILTVDADTVARVIVRAVEARRPRTRYLVGASGRASVVARRLLTDRMWDRITMKSLSG